MNDGLLIFCTGSERNAEQYRRRTIAWRDQFAGIGAHLLCVCDGSMGGEIEGVETVELHPALGRPSFDSSIFPGWKRSFVEGIRRGYGYRWTAHVESDVKILNMDRFLSVAKSEGIHAGYTHKYSFCESAIVVLNDRDKAIRLAAYLSSRLYANERAERVIEYVCSPQFTLAGERCEGDSSRIKPEHDYAAQYDFNQTIR